MAHFEIYFMGLICHVSKKRSKVTTKSHAVLVNAVNHQPQIAIDNGPWTPIMQDVTFSSEGTVEASAEVLNHLPHLTYPFISGGTPDLKGRVKVHNSDGSVAAYVDYPDTDSTSSAILRIARMFDCEGVYTDSNGNVIDSFCLAQRIVLPIEQDSLTVTYDKSGAKPVTKWVLISNSAIRQSSQDFMSYRNITDAADICDVDEDCDVDCSNLFIRLAKDEFRFDKEVQASIDAEIAAGRLFDATDVECANSHWP